MATCLSIWVCPLAISPQRTCRSGAEPFFTSIKRTSMKFRVYVGNVRDRVRLGRGLLFRTRIDSLSRHGAVRKGRWRAAATDVRLVAEWPARGARSANRAVTRDHAERAG